MAPICAHRDCGQPLADAGGRYCEQHGMELAVVLAMLDEIRHVPGKTPQYVGQREPTRDSYPCNSWKFGTGSKTDD